MNLQVVSILNFPFETGEKVFLRTSNDELYIFGRPGSGFQILHNPIVTFSTDSDERLQIKATGFTEIDNKGSFGKAEIYLKGTDEK